MKVSLAQEKCGVERLRFEDTLHSREQLFDLVEAFRSVVLADCVIKNHLMKLVSKFKCKVNG